jgi:hypothetical protein
MAPRQPPREREEQAQPRALNSVVASLPTEASHRASRKGNTLTRLLHFSIAHNQGCPFNYGLVVYVQSNARNGIQSRPFVLHPVDLKGGLCFGYKQETQTDRKNKQ